MSFNTVPAEFIIGKIFHPSKQIYVSAIGYNFKDGTGVYQFFKIGDTKDHFRKKPTLDDVVNPIDYEVYDQIRSLLEK